ncbi:hypothetical protein CGRA01v4_06346 [Colletotrichum graminicola]|nr:hypothetical protein CGRA01v4_06346 [Colletotrichum graminicola]
MVVASRRTLRFATAWEMILAPTNACDMPCTVKGTAQ